MSKHPQSTIPDLDLMQNGQESNPPHLANGSQDPAPSRFPDANKGQRTLPSHATRSRGWLKYVIGLGGLLLLGGGIYAFVAMRPTAARPDVLLHQVKKENLVVTVVEKGTLESADNLDIVCKVKAGTKGFASTINWVIADGSRVKAGERLMILDDSALQEQLQAQQIVVDTNEAAKIKAEEDLAIVLKKNESDLSTAQTNVALAEIELEKYLGLEFGRENEALAAVIGAPGALAEAGDFKQKYDDITGQVRLAESDVEQNRERSAWADRMVKQKYMSAAQAQAEKSKLDSSIEKLRSLQAQKNLLTGYERKKTLTDLKSKLDLARQMYDLKVKETHSLQVQAESELRHKLSLFQQARDKFREIKEQIDQCKIVAPRDGMVVYFKSETNRFMNNTQGLIEQGQPVKEGQKLLRMPNLEIMQVNTKVHEAMVDRIKEDMLRPTGVSENVRLNLAIQPDFFSRLVSQRDEVQDVMRERFRRYEFEVAKPGQRATVRVDSQPDKLLPGHVKSIAAVASQADAWVSDVKMFPTVVLIDGKVERLKPDASAEVTIHIDGVNNVLCVPLQAVFTVTDQGKTIRKVFVKTAAGGYEEREVTLGIFNQKMIEVKSGVSENEEVVINPKVLLGDTKAKTNDGGQGDGKGGGEKGGYPGGGQKGAGGGGEKGAGGPGGGGEKGGNKKKMDGAPPPADTNKG